MIVTLPTGSAQGRIRIKLPDEWDADLFRAAANADRRSVAEWLRADVLPPHLVDVFEPGETLETTERAAALLNLAAAVAEHRSATPWVREVVRRALGKEAKP